MAEIDLNVIARQCLNRRIESVEKREIQAWGNKRNKNPMPIC